MHMEDGILLTETETMLDTVLAAFKYACRNEAAAEEPAEPVEAAEAEEEAVEPAQTAEAEEEAEEPAESGQAAAEEADQQPVTEVPEQEESREMEQLALSERERLYQEGRKLLTGTDGDPDPEKAFEYFSLCRYNGTGLSIKLPVPAYLGRAAFLPAASCRRWAARRKGPGQEPCPRTRTGTEC